MYKANKSTDTPATVWAEAGALNDAARIRNHAFMTTVIAKMNRKKMLQEVA